MDTTIDNTELEKEEQVETPPPVDAKIIASISDNKIEGYLTIEPPYNDGAAPTLEQMKVTLSDYSISYNVNLDKLKEIEAEPIYNKKILIATGVAHINGEDGTFSFKVDTEKKDIAPKKNEDDTVDYHDLDTVLNVKKGQTLCVITMPTTGTSGTSVKGNILMQKKGKPVPSLLGKNTELSDDGTTILSKIDGQVEFKGKKINVSEVLFIKGDVDYSTGNIKVLNNLVIVGRVLPGFEVEASGSIEIRGMVQSSKIKSGGSITLKSGIVNSELQCNGDLTTKYIEGCEMIVKGNIDSKYIINSNVKCNKNIKLTGPMAKLVGGNYTVGQNIEARTIGSVANVKTILELGNDIAVLGRRQEINDQIMQMRIQNSKLEPLITMQKQLEAVGKLTDEKRQMLEKANNAYKANKELLELSNIELNEIEQVIDEKNFGKIVCTGIVYPGTKIVIGIATHFVKKQLDHASFYYDEGLIRWN